MAGVSFDDQPHFASSFEVQGIAGGQSQGNIHFHTAVDAGGDEHIPPLQGDQLTYNHVTSAEAYRIYDGQQNVAGTNSDAEMRAGFGANQRRSQENGIIRLAARPPASRHPASHGAAILVH